ncbi:Tol-Pal system subunit TolQ, partial [Candidatus Thioglobus sp.]|nr:Tol-Pal system subunit TolQ [Candidatus Thioglobus sp.]
MDSSLSIFSLIISAGFVVQVIMFVLVLMSIYSWTVIMSKKKTLMDASKDIKSFHNNFLADTDLSILHGQIPDQVSNRSPM